MWPGNSFRFCVQGGREEVPPLREALRRRRALSFRAFFVSLDRWSQFPPISLLAPVGPPWPLS